MVKLKLQVGKLTSKDTGILHSESELIAQAKQGFDELQKIVESIGKQFDAELSAEVLFEASVPTFNKSQDYCPYRTGALRGSGYLEITSFRGSPRVEMGYAKGGDPWYAVLVHEMPETFHKPPTRSHWLLAAMTEDLNDLRTRLEKGYRDVMGQAAGST